MKENSRTAPTAAVGYSESKCVAEAILAAANKQSRIPVTILHVGQAAGSTNREDLPWSKQEWLYPVLKASKALDLIAAKLAPIDWTPIDQVAMIISKIIAASTRSEELQVFNVVNPRAVSWSLLVEIQQERFGREAKVVPLKEWLKELRSRGAQQFVGPMLELALRLVDQMGDGKEEIEYNTEKSVGVSKTLAAMKPIDKALLEMLLDQWEP
jgi:nucleoside-diphosphate-sugar epimerase